MEKQYKKIQDFVDDVHREVSLREMVMELGIWTDEDFHGSFVRCPFHGGGTERTPSLQIGDSFFKCYAEENTKGDLFKFLEIQYGLGFLEAVQMAADHLGVSLDGAVRTDRSLERKLQQEWDHYLQAMRNAPQHVQQLCKQYFPLEVGLDENLGSQGYLVLAFKSKTGKVLGFTKRRICEQDEPKWKHSSTEGTLLSQCSNLFNLDRAAHAVQKHHRVVVVEGPKDAVAYLRLGIQEVVAVCGSHNVKNLTKHLSLVHSWVLSMDADESGLDGALAAMTDLVRNGVHPETLEMVLLPDGKDPYDVQDQLQELLDQRVNGLLWFFQHADQQRTQELFQLAKEHMHPHMLHQLCKAKNMNVLQAHSYLDQSKLKKEKNTEEVDEKQLLLAMVGLADLEVPPDKLMDPSKAKKILKMKYGMNL